MKKPWAITRVDYLGQILGRPRPHRYTWRRYTTRERAEQAKAAFEKQNASWSKLCPNSRRQNEDIRIEWVG